jgi:hypothetical protein
MIKIYNNFLTKEDFDKINQLENTGRKVEKMAGVKNVIYTHKDANWIIEKLKISGTIHGGNFFETPNPFQSAFLPTHLPVVLSHLQSIESQSQHSDGRRWLKHLCAEL